MWGPENVAHFCPLGTGIPTQLALGVGARKCGAFLSSWDRDPHPTCTRCRGKICTKDMTCDFCVGWSLSQWEAFAKKRSYKDRKRSSRPSGSLSPATATSPHAGTSSEVCTLRPLLLLPSLQEGRLRGGGGGVSGCTLCCVP